MDESPFKYHTKITYRQMTNNPCEIHVAARGWLHPSWHGSFYPEDLPEDWQLSYYSNEFRAVVVPASEWTNLDHVEMERWIEDVPEEFIFYLEVEDSLTNWEQTAEIIKPMAEQLGGFLLRPLETDADLSMISANVAAATQIAPVSVLLPEGVEPSATGKNLLKQYGVQCAWNVGQGNPDWVDSTFDSKLLVVHVVGNINFTARQWRETIEASMSKGMVKDDAGGIEGNQTILMVFDNDDPKINDLRTATMIGELMEMPASLQQK